MTLDLLHKLKTATIRAQQEDDLPDFLAERIFIIIDQGQIKQTLHDNIEELIEQITIYDTYGQTGYIGMGVNNIILEGTINRLEKLLLDSST